ncbi:hypothetical protein HOK51_05460 [Candidatus Woesearchaeota archaeon]|nr:hypothetical protein [Candidatus Woesearchaeota archaeon]MBT6519275.1 hypothetical protein [Candidatus Woesearchaeota archaeon]MBT7368467.1 hypothetical protein [Candidatus Woesearchaeota archaeon]
MATQSLSYSNEILDILKNHLVGNYSDSLTRFSYLNSGAESFVRLTQNPNYTSYDVESQLLSNLIPAMSSIISDVNNSNLQLIDFGVGDGLKSECIITDLSCRHNISYLGLDMSKDMLNIAQRDQNGIGILAEHGLCDFSNIENLNDFLNRDDSTQLILMLGNTLTNEVNMEQYLSDLRNLVEAAENRTYFLIGLELIQEDINSIVKEYRTEENYELTFLPLEMIGVDRTLGCIDIGFNESLGRIEEWFRFNSDYDLEIDDETLTFRPGDAVLLSVTYKPTLQHMKNIVSNSGWREEVGMLSENESYLLMLMSV